VIIFHQASPLKRQLQQLRSQGQQIGFVPTMGALHAGHLSLIERAKTDNEQVVCSIFVNPTQFNDPADLAAYPRTLPEDIALLESVGCDILFVPTVAEIYPANEIPLSYGFGKLETIFEGEFRPGHFKGVGQVVNKLLRNVEPNRLYLGQKDYQQCIVITDLIRQMGWAQKTAVIVCPTDREASGLARSSRNQRLSAEGRESAINLHRVLQQCRAIYPRYSPADLVSWAKVELDKDPLIEPEYFQFVHPHSLAPITNWNKQPAVWVLVAAWVADIRLIDNDYLFT